MIKYLKLLRVKHYFKNFLIFLPLVFSKNIFNINLLTQAIIAFFAFSFITSSIYIINDIKDRERDKLHKTKATRPIASGQISIKTAILVCVIMLSLALLLNCIFFKNNYFALCTILFYFVMNLCYSFGLKNIPILDVTILATGFLLRLFYGSAATGIELSNWFCLTMIFASFYLGFGKRRNELSREGTNKREVLKYYTYNFLDKNMYTCLGLAIVFYALWTLDMMSKTNTSNLIWTVPIIAIIVFKYSINIEQDSDGDPIEVILKDYVLVALLVIYALIMYAVLYL